MLCVKRVVSNEQEWHEFRHNGIGGSDAAAVLGLSPYKNSLDLYLEKTGPVKVTNETNEILERGHRLEPAIRQLFQATHPEKKVTYDPFDTLENIKYPFLHATLDGQIEDEDDGLGILEIKTCEVFKYEKLKVWFQEVPIHYLLQVLHYMLVNPEFNYATFMAWVKFRDDVRIIEHTYYRKDYLQDLAILLNAEKQFWKRVQSKEPPAVKLF